MKKAIVLGGIAAHVELIKQLKQRGYYTILVDYLLNSPAKTVADLHLQESTLDKEKVLEIAKDYGVSLVLSGCVDQANITACYVSEQLGLHVPYTYETSVKITNKGYMKKVMADNNIPTSKYVYAENLNDVKDLDLVYPIIVKPADSNSANGVKKANNANEMLEYLQKALEISRNGRAIVEEYVEGREFSAYCYVQDGHAKLLMTNERISTFDGPYKVIKCYASIMPARLPEGVEKDAEAVAEQIAKAFDLNNTPLFYQAMYKDGKINVIEFAPRFGGGVCFYTIPLNTGFNAIGSIISSMLGEKVDLSLSNAAYVASCNTVYAEDCTFDHVEGFDKLVESKDIQQFFAYKTQGAHIDNSSASGGRVGAFVVKASSHEEMINKVREAYEKTNVISADGKNVLRKDLNLYAQNI